IVTVPLPATIVPLTLVVLHPPPVQTEIGSAFAVPWAKPSIPKTATAKSDFLRFENLGISRLLRGGHYLCFQAADSKADLLVRGVYRRAKRGKCALKQYQPDKSLG